MERHIPILRTVKAPKKRKGLRPISPKTAQKNKVYARLKADYLTAHPYCQYYLEEHGLTEGDLRASPQLARFVPMAIDIHHRKGRGKYLLDTSTWMALSRPAHRWLHDHPKEAYAKGYLLPRK